MTVTLEYAETHLSDLLAKAGAGEEIVIAKSETTRVRLVAEPAAEEVAVLPLRQLGTMRHTLILPEGWEEDWKRMGEELTEIMENGPVFPPFPPFPEER